MERRRRLCSNVTMRKHGRVVSLQPAGSGNQKSNECACSGGGEFMKSLASVLIICMSIALVVKASSQDTRAKPANPKDSSHHDKLAVWAGHWKTRIDTKETQFGHASTDYFGKMFLLSQQHFSVLRLFELAAQCTSKWRHHGRHLPPLLQRCRQNF